jgi:endogenous inhibitor of DNA gyrase (YacG/DUF329 family)
VRVTADNLFRAIFAILIGGGTVLYFYLKWRNRYRCPYCGRRVRWKDINCPHCGDDMKFRHRATFDERARTFRTPGADSLRPPSRRSRSHRRREP